ncbi:hypothetical protein CNMCM5793_004968 [Aspergillus hiratsukae]|uniref:Polyketide synthase n=1 Tax=Aspergillus hiratsukae TaxID=1194566 RepID=A0A8H6UXC9_9EURO|nr:hypothetical protein CNMCM5793_004968 [Aspergillus hiratsukae]KAF7170307.1 hypothetical protein CNMCM6106_005040 [Aspergillus hiratsukae]
MGVEDLPQQASPSDIAVIGLACRFPGGASDATKFWDLLYHKRSAFTEAPSTRYNADAFHHPAADKLNTLGARGGHFLEEDVAGFDAPFFNITAQEATAMDPTARMLLEVTYEALENGGMPVESLVGSDTSCYVGCFTRDYHEMLMRDAETSPILVGLHLACQGLRAGESKTAVVCGANLILSPDLAMWLSNLHMTSQDGLSRSFADEVTGYGRGEGIAAVIIKPLADALKDGDTIRAVIRGTGVNQDGHTTGITLPNSEAQADLIRSTYSSAGLDLGETAYFEAHGTGTAVGDPLELGAVAHTVSKGRQAGDKLFVGSVKSNIGHLEGAAGLAGVIKCVLMLENRTILPNIHFDKPNKRIPFDAWKIQVPTSVLSWPAGRRARASVNSFGYGGTNAHAILDNTEEYLAASGLENRQVITAGPGVPGADGQRTRLFIFSARDEGALRRILAQHTHHLSSLKSQVESRTEPEQRTYLDRLAFTLSNRRSQFSWKAYVSASSIAELKEAVSLSGSKSVRSSNKARLAFVFTGQGAQWAQMGADLLVYPAFRASVTAAQSYLSDVEGCPWSVLEELQKSPDESNIHLAKISQPLCTIIQVAMVELLRAWNIEPAGVVGHSSGEIAAAFCYGALSREEAWAIAYWRGVVCSELSTETTHLKGAMMAVGLSRDAADGYIRGTTRGRIVVACVNSPSSVTISGDEAGIDELLEKLTTDAVFCRKLKVENAYHSHHMKLVAEKYMEHIRSISARQPVGVTSVKMASSVTGDIVDPADLGPEYWVKNLVSPVLFSDAVHTLLKDTGRRRRHIRAGESAFDLLLEVGPHGALKGPLRQIVQHHGFPSLRYQSVLMRGENATKTAVQAAGDLYLQGVPVSVAAVNNVQFALRPLVDLPSYPWNHSLRHWSESRVSKNYRFRKYPRHDLLGAPVPDCTEDEPRWRNIIRASEQAWVTDHVVHSNVLYPGSGTIAMVLEAVQQIADKDQTMESIKLKDVRLSRAIVIPDSAFGIETVLQLRRHRCTPGNAWTGWWEFSVYSCLENERMEENSSGLVSIVYRLETAGSWRTGKDLICEEIKREYLKTKKQCTRSIEVDDFYKATKTAGLNYGPLFQGLTEIFTDQNRCCSVINVPDTRNSMPAHSESPHLIHPTTLDIIFHSMFAASGDGGLDFQTAAVPIAFDSLTFSMDLPSGPNAQFSGFCSLTRDGPRDLVADIYMSDMAWDEPKIQITGIRCRELPVSSSLDASSGAAKAPFGTLAWKPDIDLVDGYTLPRCIAEAMSQPDPCGGKTSRDFEMISTADESVGELAMSISAIVDLAAHKNPDMSILQIGGSNTVTQSLISILGADPTAALRCSSYTIVDANAAVVANTAQTFNEWSGRISFRVLDTNPENKDEIFQEGSFDAIIAINAYERESFLRDAHKWLRHGGIILTADLLQPDLTVTWTDILEKADNPILLSPVAEFCVGEGVGQVSLFVSRKGTPEEVIERIDTVYIIEASEKSTSLTEVGEKLLQSLGDRGVQAKRVEWPPEPAELQGKNVISLLELESPLLADISPADFDSLKTIILQSARWLWVSMGDDPVMQTAIGYLRVLQNENVNLDLRYLLLEDKPHRDPSHIGIVTKVALLPTTDREYMELNGSLCINRWVADDGLGRLTSSENGAGTNEHIAVGDAPAGLKLVDGLINHQPSLFFDIDDNVKGELASDEVEIEVKSLGISDRDTISSKMDLAKELSGVVKAVGKTCSRFNPGDRVCALSLGPYRTSVRVKEALCQLIPNDVPFREAACKTVLIQGAASAVGQAGLQLAQLHGATALATVDTEEQRNVVESCAVLKEHIFRDTDPDLAAAISRLTNGRGIDIIINSSMAGEAMQQLWQCVAPEGIFVDINTESASANATLDIRHSKQQLFDGRYIAGCLDDAPNPAFETVRSSGGVSIGNVADAFERHQSQKKLGKVLLSIDLQDRVPIASTAKSPLTLDSNATYLLAGGLGGLGRSLVRLLAFNGARYLAIVSRSGAGSSDAASLIEEVNALGVCIRLYACDLSDKLGMEKVINQCASEMPPIRGVIQSAAVLNDSIYDNMTHEQWKGAIRPKVQGSWVLHQLLPRDLQFFVMLSSIAGVVGNRSQANYAAGNTYQDALAHYRRRRGLTAVSVDLGLMVGIGLIAERGGETNLRKWEAVGINETEFHALITASMAGSFGQKNMPTQVICGLPTGGILDREALDVPFYFDNPRFQVLKKMGRDRTEAHGDDVLQEAESLSAELSCCQSMHEASGLITATLCGRLARSLQTAAENIDSSKPLHAYGVDSLMAVEIRTWILVHLKAEISLFDVISSSSVVALASRIAAVSKLVSKELD